jgi:cell division protease FtsH
MVNYPDTKGREEILKVHSRGKPLGPDVILKTIAKSTSGFTGADLANLLNESALLAVRRGKKAITQSEIEEATIKVVMGAEKKSHIVSDKDKMVTAYHEAGHAVVSYFLPTQDPVHQISIIRRGMAAGYTMYLPTEEEKGHTSRNQLLEQICSLLGGRAAEQLTQNDICTGASNDIERATDIARSIVTRFGMSEKLGLVKYGSDNNEVFLGRDFSSTPNYSEKTAALIDDEIEAIVMAQYNKAIEILKNNMPMLHETAKVLFEKEKIDGNEFIAIMENKPLEIEE